jgi:hypothetical protein
MGSITVMRPHLNALRASGHDEPVHDMVMVLDVNSYAIDRRLDHYSAEKCRLDDYRSIG